MKCRATQLIWNYSFISRNTSKLRRKGEIGKSRDDRRKHSSRKSGRVYVLNSCRIGLRTVVISTGETGTLVTASFKGARLLDSKVASWVDGFNGGGAVISDSEDESEDSEPTLGSGGSFDTWLVASAVSSSTFCLLRGSSMSSIWNAD